MKQQKCALNDHRLIQVKSEDVGAIQRLLNDQERLIFEICDKKQLLDLKLVVLDKNGVDIDHYRVKWMLEMISCMSNELEELRDALPWKHWKTYDKDHFRKQLPEIKYEVIDLLHFLLEMLLILGINGEEMLQLYASKNKQNKERQNNGY